MARHTATKVSAQTRRDITGSVPGGAAASPALARRSKRALVVGLAGALAGAMALAVAREARADEPLRPGTRPMFVDLALGPTLFLGASGGGGSVESGGGFPRFKLAEEFGYHFSGDSSGPALGVSVEESFGYGLVGFEPGLKFWYDIPIGDISFYLTPSAKIGYAGMFPEGGGGSAHAFNIQLGFEAKLIIEDRGLVFFRPVTVDMWGGDIAFGGAGVSGFGAFWDLMFGGGATF